VLIMAKMNRLMLLLAAAAISTACGGGTRESDPATLRLASFGGSFQEALDREVVQPIAGELGVSAVVEAYSGEYDRLAATIRNGTNTWDLVHVETVFLEQGRRESLTLPIDWSVVDRSAFVEGAAQSHGIAALAWSLALAWNSTRLPSGVPPPQSWADFFDVKRYPGPRCLRRVPDGNLELALLADGLPPGGVYNGGLDVARALKKLGTIKPNISWWSSGAELEQKLSSTCALAAAWNGRVLNLKNQGAPVDLTYAGAIHQYDWWVIPANAPNAAAAQRFLAAFSRATGQVAIARQFGYGPVSRGLLRDIPADLLAVTPSAPENAAAGIQFDGAWWGGAYATVTEQWNQWLIEK
jgi:putative spermidine/putrescine transport system substrate-binding protein